MAQSNVKLTVDATGAISAIQRTNNLTKKLSKSTDELKRRVDKSNKSLFDNVEYDRCIFCGGSRTEIARTDFTIMFSEFEYNTGSICKTCYSANAKQVKAI